MAATTLTSSMIQRQVEENSICVLTFDRPESGANIFDAATLADLKKHLDFVERDRSLRGLLVTSAKKSIFIAGADLKTLLRQAETGQLRDFIAEGQRIFNRLADLKIPTCAAIHGACAGGGYEIALACDWRVASDDPATRIGLPETTLGLVPAWGGCTRLPRLIGKERASEVILKGKLYPANEALQLGLVDEVASRDQLLEAARKKLQDGKRSQVKMEGRVPASPAPQELGPLSSSSNAAPARAFEIITKSLPIDQSLAMELDAIVELGNTESTRNLIRNFFLAEKYKRGTSKPPAERIVHAAIIGAGIMGSGIAQWLSSRGVTVILRDVSREMVDRGLANIERTYADAVKRGILTEAKAQEGRARIICSTAHVEMRDVQIVIEAASEKIEIKREIFRELSAAAPKAILATNTSALPIQELAEQTGSPEHVVGLHFFNPVSRMKLVEVVVSDRTSEETRERALGFARQIGKLPVVVRDRPGFLVNRLLFPYLLDAAELFESGVAIAQIDQPLVQWGMPMGPLRLIDEIGVDITIDIASTLEKAYGRRDHAVAVLHWLREAKMLGRKTGAGFYSYEGKSQQPNEALEKWIAALHGDPEGAEGPEIPADRHRDPRVQSDADAITRRLMFLMVDEAARCVQEKVVDSPEDADYGMILGTGFAPFRGGPLRFADHFGLKKIVDELSERAKTEEKFAPCELLKKHARDGTKFYNE
jgi:3-hydroxyacyl-CoA dehydrogenase / enoyl-CoA hydratase / 3-hydroxybutyryl-CoA epimerase